MRKIQGLLAFITVVSLVLITGLAFAEDVKAQGQPFQALQKQIDDLKAQIENNLKQINVYDDNGQYLGILLGHEPMRQMTPRKPLIEIFIPELNYSVFIEQHTGNVARCKVMFKDASCSGPESYLFDSHIICRDARDNYHVGLEVLSVGNSFLNSMLDDGGSCGQWPNGGTYFQSLDLTPQELPFTIPVAVSLHYQTE